MRFLRTVLVDITAPTQGSVRDGTPDEEDTVFSSSASSVAVTWEGFEDPESDIAGVTVSFKKQGKNVLILVFRDYFINFARFVLRRFFHSMLSFSKQLRKIQ